MPPRIPHGPRPGLPLLLAMLLLAGCDALVSTSLTRKLEVSGLPAATVAGSPFTLTVCVRGADTYVGDLALTTTDPQAVFPPLAFTAADNGCKPVSITLVRAGAQTVSLRATGVAGVTGQVTVQPAAPASLAVAADANAWRAGVAHALTVQAVDPYGNLATAHSGDVTFTSADPNAVLSAGGPLLQGRGTFAGFTLYAPSAQVAITAQDAQGLRSTTHVQITPGLPAAMALSGVPTASLLGAPHTMTVQLSDAFGNLCTDFTGTLTANSNDAAAVFQLPGAKFTAQDAGSKAIGTVQLNSVGTFDVAVVDAADHVSAHQGVTLQRQLVGLATAAQEETMCALVDSGDVKCWGNGTEGGLGAGNANNRGDSPDSMGANLPSVDLGLGVKATQVSVGWNSACALLASGNVKCWGHNNDGELGVGDTVHRGDSAAPGHAMGDSLPAVNLGGQATAIASGRYHHCAILTGGVVKCWGYNGDGELGVGDTTNRGDTPAHVPAAVNVGRSRSARALAMQAYGSCALLDDGTVACWGFNGCRASDPNACSVDGCGPNGCGELGVGDGNNRGDSPAAGHAIVPLSLGTGRSALAIAAGDYFGCALLDTHAVKCWGMNNVGQLGLGDTTSRGDSSAAGHSMGSALPTAALPAGRTALAVHAGIGYACAQLDDLQVACWGWNQFGQLGVGNTANVGGAAGDVPTAALLGTGRTAVRMTSMAYSSCAQLDNGQLRCWGANDYGELGLGDILRRGDSPATSGDNIPPTPLW